MLGISLRLEQTINLTRFRIDIDIEVTRCSRKTRDCLDVGSQSISARVSKEISGILMPWYLQVSCTDCQSHISNRHCETSWCSLQCGVVTERVLRFCNADG